MSDPIAEFVENLAAAVQELLNGVNTSAPGRIVSYDAARNRATVRASLPKRIADGSDLAPPETFEVPLAHMAGGGARVSVPVKAGDGVLLIFSQRSLENWLQGSDVAPDDPRVFDISDAIAIPGLSAGGPPVDPENLVMSMGESTISIKPGEEIEIKTTTLKIKAETIEIDCPMTTSNGDIVAGTISLRHHIHPGTGVPVP